MRTKSIVVAVLWMALMAAPTTASAADGAKPLRGVNVISGDSSGYVQVHLPKASTVDPAFYPNDSMTVEGEGKLHGIVLRQVGPKPTEELMLAVGRFDPDIFCTGCGTRIDQGISVVGGGSTGRSEVDGRWVLPAGDYRLYFVTDGPGTVTLRLPGLDGEQALGPEVPTAATTQILPLLSPVDAQNHRTYGGTGRLGTDGILFETHLIYFGLHAHSQLWTCWYLGEANHPLAFYPSCPTAEGEEGLAMWFPYSIVQAGAGATAGVGMLRTGVPGTFSAGGTMSSVATTSSSGWAAAWIDFESLDGGAASTPDPGAPAPESGAPRDPGQRPATSSGAARTRVLARRVAVRGRRASVRLRCEGADACAGALQIGNDRRRAYRVPAGKSARLRVAISKALALKAKRKRGFATTLSIAEGSAVQTVRVTLRKARR